VSLERNKQIVRRFVEEINKRNLAILDELVSPDYVDHEHQLRSLEGLKQLMTIEFKGFPDFHITIEDMVAEGDKVWVRLKETGTHKGEYFGLAPTGRKFAITSIHNLRITDGKFVEDFSVSDDLRFFERLGVIETTEGGKELFPRDLF
jgi:C-1 hydroxylase